MPEPQNFMNENNVALAVKLGEQMKWLKKGVITPEEVLVKCCDATCATVREHQDLPAVERAEAVAVATVLLKRVLKRLTPTRL